MSDKASFLRDCVITIASDDYENFELIFEQTKQLVKITNEAEVAEALRSLIDDGLLEAYELSAQPAYSKKVGYSASRLHELWDYVTPRARRWLKLSEVSRRSLVASQKAERPSCEQSRRMFSLIELSIFESVFAPAF